MFVRGPLNSSGRLPSTLEFSSTPLPSLLSLDRPDTSSRNMLRTILTSVPRRAPLRLLSRAPSITNLSLTRARLLSRTTITTTTTTTVGSMASLPPVSPPITTTLPSDSFQILSESNKPGLPEDALFEQQTQDVEAWWATPRYAGIKRPYTAADVVSKRGSLQQSYPSSVMARKLWNLVQERLANGEPIHTSMCPSPIPIPIPIPTNKHEKPAYTDYSIALLSQWVPSTPSR